MIYFDCCCCYFECDGDYYCEDATAVCCYHFLSVIVKAADFCGVPFMIIFQVISFACSQQKSLASSSFCVLLLHLRWWFDHLLLLHLQLLPATLAKVISCFACEMEQFRKLILWCFDFLLEVQLSHTAQYLSNLLLLFFNYQPCSCINTFPLILLLGVTINPLILQLIELLRCYLCAFWASFSYSHSFQIIAAFSAALSAI